MMAGYARAEIVENTEVGARGASEQMVVSSE